MGGGLTRAVSPEGEAALLKYPRLFEALLCTKDVDLWTTKFGELDHTSSGRLSVTVCLPISNSESTPFNDKLFRFMDVEGTGSMDLRGFAFSTWNFCTLDKHGLASYVYDLVSAEDVSLDKYGLKAVLSDVYASRLAEESQEVKALKRIIDKLEPMKVLSRAEFISFSDKHPVFFAPLARMQDRIRQATFGSSYWRSLEHKRKACQSKLYMPQYWAQLQSKCYQAETSAKRR